MIHNTTNKFNISIIIHRFIKRKDSLDLINSIEAIFAEKLDSF